MQNLSLAFSKDVLKFSGVIDVKEVIGEPLRHDLVLSKCKSINDGCDIFANSTTEDTCNILKEADGHLKEFFPNIIPRPTCPIQQGMYEMDKAVINLDTFSNLPIDGVLWHVELYIYQQIDEEDYKTIACFQAHVRVFISSARTKGSRG